MWKRVPGDGTYQIRVGIPGTMQSMVFKVNATTGLVVAGSLQTTINGRPFVDTTLFFDGMAKIVPAGTSALDILVLMSRISNISENNGAGHVYFTYNGKNYHITRDPATNEPIVTVL